ncbi:MAG: hypothetical protein KDB07_08535 [Planctomycetes bacterium]|nr:hypothetical protein [Planctomycetota bacterium]
MDEQHKTATDSPDVMRINKFWFTILGTLLTSTALFVGATIYVSGKAEQKDLQLMQIRVTQLDGTIREMRARYSTQMISFQNDLKKVHEAVREIKQLIVHQNEQREMMRMWYERKKRNRRP